MSCQQYQKIYRISFRKINTDRITKYTHITSISKITNVTLNKYHMSKTRNLREKKIEAKSRPKTFSC